MTIYAVRVWAHNNKSKDPDSWEERVIKCSLNEKDMRNEFVLRVSAAIDYGRDVLLSSLDGRESCEMKMLGDGYFQIKYNYDDPEVDADDIRKVEFVVIRAE